MNKSLTCMYGGQHRLLPLAAREPTTSQISLPDAILVRRFPMKARSTE